MLKVEIGGGARPRGDGFLNVDQIDGADIQHDLNVTPWPFNDASVDELYSSHCIEHVRCPVSFVREVARICRVGASVEIRAPDPLSEGAFFAGHLHAVGPTWARHLSEEFPELFWSGLPRRLKLQRIEPGADSHYFHLARNSPRFRGWTDEEILTWIPRTRHENQMHFKVIENEYL